MPNDVPLGRRLVGVGEAARYLGVSRDTVEGMLAVGTLHKVTLPGVRRVLVDVRELDRLIEGTA